MPKKTHANLKKSPIYIFISLLFQIFFQLGFGENLCYAVSYLEVSTEAAFRYLSHNLLLFQVNWRLNPSWRKASLLTYLCVICYFFSIKSSHIDLKYANLTLRNVKLLNYMYFNGLQNLVHSLNLPVQSNPIYLNKFNWGGGGGGGIFF